MASPLAAAMDDQRQRGERLTERGPRYCVEADGGAGVGLAGPLLPRRKEQHGPAATQTGGGQLAWSGAGGGAIDRARSEA
jgi:hypothetical protein